MQRNLNKDHMMICDIFHLLAKFHLEFEFDGVHHVTVAWGLGARSTLKMSTHPDEPHIKSSALVSEQNKWGKLSVDVCGNERGCRRLRG